MKCGLFLFLSALIVCTQSLFATDGLAVTNRVDDSWQNYGVYGDLWRYDIASDKLTDSSCIFKGEAHWPKISMDGKRVAFVNKKADGYYVSVVSIDGGTVSDLVKIPGGTNECHVSWPLGSWVYYNEGKNANNKAIWRVNADNPSQNEKVGSLSGQSWIRVWDMSADGKRFNYQVKSYGVWKTTIEKLSGAVVCEVGTCNPAISASGQWLCGLQNSGHTILIIGDWEEKEKFGVNNKTEMAPWMGMGDNFGGMDKNNWSANSDKWACVRIGWPGDENHKGGRFGKNGTVQVVVNWFDKKAILTTTNNPKPTSGGPRWTSECGDMWIAGIDGIETVDGKPVSASHLPRNKESRAAMRNFRIGILNGNKAITIGPDAQYSIKAYDAKGRMRLMNNATGDRLDAKSSHSDGVYFIRAEH